MVLEILSGIEPWKKVSGKLGSTYLGWGSGDPILLGAGEYTRRYGLNNSEAREAAGRDISWAEGQLFLDKHPKVNHLPWSGKSRNRG